MLDYASVEAELRKGWTKGAYGLRPEGGREEGGPVCLIGAIGAVCHLNIRQSEAWVRENPLILDAVTDLYPSRLITGYSPARALEYFNDNDDTTLDDVIAVVRRARELDKEAVNV